MSFTCPTCYKEFKLKKAFENHQKKHEKTIPLMHSTQPPQPHVQTARVFDEMSVIGGDASVSSESTKRSSRSSDKPKPAPPLDTASRARATNESGMASLVAKMRERELQHIREMDRLEKHYKALLDANPEAEPTKKQLETALLSTHQRLNQALEDLKLNRQNSERDIAQLRDEIQRLHNEKSNYAQQIHTAEERIQQIVHAEKTAMNAQIGRVVEDANNRLQGLTNAYAQLDKKYNEALQAKEKAEKSFAMTVKNVETLEKSAQAERAGFLRELETLKQRDASSQRDIQELQRKLEAYQAHVEKKVTAIVTSHAQELETLERENAYLRERVSVLSKPVIPAQPTQPSAPVPPPRDYEAELEAYNKFIEDRLRLLNQEHEKAIKELTNKNTELTTYAQNMHASINSLEKELHRERDLHAVTRNDHLREKEKTYALHQTQLKNKDVALEDVKRSVDALKRELSEVYRTEQDRQTRHQTQLHDLRKEVIQHEKMVKSLQDSEQELKRTIFDLQLTIKALQQEISQNNESFATRMNQAKSSISEKDKVITELERRIQQLSTAQFDTCLTKEKIDAHYSQQLAVLRTSFDQEKERLVNVTRSLEAEKTKLLNDKGALERELLRKEEEVKVLVTKMNSIETESKSAKSSIESSLHSEMQRMKRQYDELLREQQAVLTSERTRKEHEVSVLRGEIETMKSITADLEKRITTDQREHQQELSKLKSKYEETAFASKVDYEGRLSKAEANVRVVMAKMESLKADFATKLTEEMRKKDTKLIELENKAVVATQLLETEKARAENSIQTIMTTSNQEIALLRQALHKVNQDLGNRDILIQDLQNRMPTLEASLVQRANELDRREKALIEETQRSVRFPPTKILDSTLIQARDKAMIELVQARKEIERLKGELGHQTRAK